MSKISVYFIIVAILALVFGGAGCGWFAPNEPSTIDQTVVSTSVHLPEQSMATMAIGNITLVVTGSGIDSIKTTLTLEGTRARGQVSVPVNKSLTFTVTVFDAANVIIMQGSYTTSVQKNQTNSIPIVLQFQVPALILTPTLANLAVGDSVLVKLEARHVTNLSSIGARINFNPARLEVVELNVDPAFMSSNNGQVVLLPSNQDFTAGNVDIVMGVLPATSAVNGNGTLGTVLFRTLVADTVDLSISVDTTTDSDLGVFNSSAQPVDALTLGNRLIIQ